MSGRSQEEFRLACFVADTLRRFCAPDVKWWTHFPAGEARPFKIVKGKRISPTGQRLQRMGTFPGVSDYIFWLPDRRTFFLELKRPGINCKLSADQEAFKAAMLACGHRYAVADSGQAAIEILASWGILSHRVRAAA